MKRLCILSPGGPSSGASPGLSRECLSSTWRSASVPPSLSDLNKLLRRIIFSLLKRLATESAREESDAWMQTLTQSVRTATGPTSDQPPGGLCAFAEGFSLHAGVSVDKSDGEGRERLARYCARPCLSLELVRSHKKLSHDGAVRPAAGAALCGRLLRSAASRTDQAPTALTGAATLLFSVHDGAAPYGEPPALNGSTMGGEPPAGQLPRSQLS